MTEQAEKSERYIVFGEALAKLKHHEGLF